jgi:tetratricopeptide (TPR) repeat protein
MLQVDDSEIECSKLKVFSSFLRRRKLIPFRHYFGLDFQQTIEHMKKLFPFLILAFIAVSSSQAQTDNDYKDLLTLFVTEKYEKCLYKAEGYTLDEKTKKDPLPYMFMSRCFYEMSKRDEFKEKYPNAFKDAMKYISKYGSKDKEKVYLSEYEDYIGQIRAAAIAQAETMMDTQKYSKAKQLYDQLLDIDPNDAGAQLMMGVVQGLMKAKKESETALAKAKAILTEKKAGQAAEELNLLKYAITMHATNLAGTSKTAAKEWLDLGLEYFPEDKEYKITYDTIVG